MRYIKVLILVCLIFLVMLFFVQNQEVFSQSMALKMDLMFIPPVVSIPLPFYTMLLLCFLIGGIFTLLMLVWDRLTISTKLTVANMRIRSLEKELKRADQMNETFQTKVIDAEARATKAEAKAAELLAIPPAKNPETATEAEPETEKVDQTEKAA